jgi:hypothetical protein
MFFGYYHKTIHTDLCNNNFVVLCSTESYLNKRYLFLKDLLPQSFQDPRLVAASVASSCVCHVGNIFICGSTALCLTLVAFQFLNYIYSRYYSLDRGSARPKASTCTQDITNTE